ncbi:hypothetical protein [Agaribacter marinus]|uniref:Uncharacterized protein n=1 Tax=Agaribacter marinus TaxID=1431249 RepID=A0AA37WJW2_9ALTE|nr:hypothetical protein [Agaribacter marinus]GLR70250.1 hypothetical protein GCM10007852_11580 [Agaribacter marinus]
MKATGKRSLKTLPKIKPFTSTETHRQLHLDARQGPVKADVYLHIPDKSTPSKWYMTSSDQVVDDFVAYIETQDKRKRARLDICINSADESITFAKAGAVGCSQTFDGLLFAAGNEELNEVKAFKTSILKRGRELRLDILPSAFWLKTSSGGKAVGGGKFGFRFVLQDKEENILLSYDPMIILPDWEPVR